MSALIYKLLAKPQPAPVAPAGACPDRPWDQGMRRNLSTLVESRVR
jgi:hypothetical protein